MAVVWRYSVQIAVRHEGEVETEEAIAVSWLS